MNTLATSRTHKRI